MIGTIAGVEASLRWGYHQAARLSAWTVTKTDGGWALTATVVDADTFRCAQRPLVFVAVQQVGAWRWPVEELQITGLSCTATLGPKEPT